MADLVTPSGEYKEDSGTKKTFSYHKDVKY